VPVAELLAAAARDADTLGSPSSETLKLRFVIASERLGFDRLPGGPRLLQDPLEPHG